MQIIDALYTYGLSEKKLHKIQKKVRHGVKVPNLYLVVLPLFQDGILEIYPYYQLLQPFYKTMWDDITVVGMASGKGSATEIIQCIAQEMCDKGIDVNAVGIKKFLGI